MKKRLCLLALTIATLTVPANISASHDVRVKLDGSYVNFSDSPFLENSRTMVPARGLFEKMGAQVRWDDKENAAWIEDEYMNIKLIIGQNTAYIFRKYDFTGIPLEVKMDVAPKVIGNRTYIPLRFLVESLEADIDWDESTSTVVIGTKKKAPVEYKVLSEGDIKHNAEITSWYNSNYKNKGIHYKIDGEKAYVIASSGEKPTGGYSIEIDKVVMVPSGNVHIIAKVLNPAPDAMVTQALSYPNILISFDTKDIKHIGGEIKDEKSVKKTLNDIGAGIKAQEVKSIQLFSLEQQKIKEYTEEESKELVEALNNGQLDDSAYIEMLCGNTMKITLNNDSKVNIISYGSKTNIVVNVEKSGEHASYHVVCPEIAKILIGK